MFNVNRRKNQFLYDCKVLAVTPGAYELIELAELTNEETNGNVMKEPDKKTMKCIMEIKQGALSFDVETQTYYILLL